MLNFHSAIPNFLEDSDIFRRHALAAPVRTFCRAAAGKIREADYILVHHQNSRYENAAAEMDRLLGLHHTPFTTLRCREGHYKEIKA